MALLGVDDYKYFHYNTLRNYLIDNYGIYFCIVFFWAHQKMMHEKILEFFMKDMII